MSEGRSKEYKPVPHVVYSVNGRSGSVVLDAADVGLENVHSDLDGKLSRAGGSMLGPIDMGGSSIQNLPIPANPQDAATKEYVDRNSRSIIGAWKNIFLKDTYQSSGNSLGTNMLLFDDVQTKAGVEEVYGIQLGLYVEPSSDTSVEVGVYGGSVEGAMTFYNIANVFFTLAGFNFNGVVYSANLVTIDSFQRVTSVLRVTTDGSGAPIKIAICTNDASENVKVYSGSTLSWKLIEPSLNP